MKNFVGVFSANHINRFIDFKSMVLEKPGKYPFQLRILTAQIQTVHTGGAYLTLNQKLTFLYYSFGIDGLKKLLYKTMNQLYKKYYLIKI